MIERLWTVSGRVGAAVLVGVVAAGCGDDDPAGPDGPIEAAYTASVSGAVSATLTGTAFFGSGTDPESGEQAWVAYLVTNEDAVYTAGQSVIFAGLGAPDERSYALEDLTTSSDLPVGGAVSVVILYEGETLSGAFASTGGTLTVSSVSSDRMAGTFDFTAEGTVFDGETSSEGTISIQGSFDARGGAFIVPPVP